MTYEELLKRPEWHNKCVQILNRDGHRCQKCGCFGFHPVSHYECEDIISLRSVLDDFFVNDMPLVEFVQNEYESTEGYIDSEAKVSKIYQHEDGTCETKIYRFNRNVFFSQRRSATIFARSKHVIYEESQVFLDYINVKCKEYGKWRDDKCKFVDNTITINFGPHFSNLVESASSFKFDRLFSENCILSVWNEPYTGAIGDQYGVLFLSSTILSITFKNYCFTIYMKPWGRCNDQNGITGGLNIHHKYYIKTNFPWEYEDDAFITLCDKCHKTTHMTQNTPIYRNARIAEAYLGNAELCNRCGGSGYLPKYEHIENGICFKCWGEGVNVM